MTFISDSSEHCCVPRDLEVQSQFARLTIPGFGCVAGPLEPEAEMRFNIRRLTQLLPAFVLLGALLFPVVGSAAEWAGHQSSPAAGLTELPTYPNDMSAAGINAASKNSADPELFDSFLPTDVLERVREYAKETKSLGLQSRGGIISVNGLTTNVLANTNHVGDAIGETQSEVSVAVFGDTIVIGWNDSRGFVAGNTLSSYAYSTNGGASFIDGGNVPLAGAGDQAFGDTGLDTDEQGNWYLVSIYVPTGGVNQNISVHNGRFIAGVLTWNAPIQAQIGLAATPMDKCMLACDRFTGNVYVASTHFLSPSAIEIARSTNKGATWTNQTLDNGSLPTTSKQGARPFCGPNGEIYVVWEKGANSINCPDGSGNVVPFGSALIAFTRSLDLGATYSPVSTVSTLVSGFLAAGPGDLRERGNEFPDIAVDRSNGPFRGNIYVTWHTAASWSANQSAGPARAEAADAANANPGGAELFNVGDDVTGTITTTGDLDYWQFSAVQGQAYLFDLAPQGFVCGVSSTTKSMRMRMYATQSPYPNPTGFPDTLLAASAQTSFLDRIVWTAPKTGSFLLRLQRSAGTAPFTYSLKVRPLTFNGGEPSRDARDVVVSRSSNQGTSWTTPVRVNDDAPGLENNRPFVSVDGKGRVGIFWHDHRDAGLGANAALTSVYGSLSRDGGATWSPNFETTDQMSFFSFNTLAVPNLGDYNQSAAYGDKTWPAWTDQRTSLGEVRNPGANTFSAGLGPEVYTTGMKWAMTLSCAGDQSVLPGQALGLNYTITNTGNIAEAYNYTVSDPAGWAGGNASGSTAVLAPGGSQTITRNGTVSVNACSDAVVVSVAAAGDLVGGQTCTTNLTIPPATITASAGVGGTITPSGAVAVACGGSQTFAIAPSAGYQIADVLVDGSSVGAVASYAFTNVHINHTIAASFSLIPAVIAGVSTATYLCPTNPCISIPVNLSRQYLNAMLGFSVTFQLSPELTLCAGTGSVTEGNYLSASGTTLYNVIDNGGGSYTADGAIIGANCGPTGLTGNLFNVGVSSSSAGGTGSITVTAVTLRDCNNNPLPGVAGAPATVPIDNQAPVVQVTSPNGGEVWLIGSSQSVTWTATDNTGVADVDIAYSTDGGASYPNVIATGIANSGSYAWTVPNDATTQARVRVTAHDVVCSSGADASDANFTIQNPTVTITASAGAGGSISPSGSVTVAYGGSQTFAVSANPCYSIADVLVDGSSVGAVSTYTFSNVQGNHTLAASFSLNTYTITASAGAGGSVSPNGVTIVNCGADQKIGIAANPCYSIADVLVDGNSVGAVSTYTFSNVQGNHTLAASFSLNTYTIAASSGPGGSISPAGAVVVNCGADQKFVVTPNSCFAIANVKVDGNSVGAVASYTFSNVTANHTIAATFVSTTLATTTVLAVSPSPSVCQQPVVLTATVTPNSATGTVEFFDGVTSLGTSSVAAGVATLAPGALSVGAHSLKAVYTPTGCFLASTSPIKAHTVNKAAVTVAVTSSPNPSMWNQPVTFTITVVPATATGTVTLKDSLTTLAVLPLSGGTANFIKSDLYTGKHTAITATYNGDACYATKTSANYAQLVYRAASSVSVGTDINPSVCGQTIKITATVTPVGATGQARFFDNGNLIGTANFSGSTGLAVLSSNNLLPGKHDLTVDYVGDSHYTGSSSNSYSQVVNPATSAVTLVSDLNPAKFGAAVHYTATVTPSDAGGTVEFFDGATSLGASPIVAGAATFTTTTQLAPGIHTVNAVYSGDACYSGAPGSMTQEITADSPPQVTVLYPNGHETLCLDGDVKLTWTATDNTAITTLKLELSRDNGGSWETIAANAPNTGSYVWHVTAPGTNVGSTEVYSAILRVTATDNAGVTGSDDSNGPFSIFDCAVATVITELDAEAVDLGVQIKWAFAARNAFTSVVIERSPSESGPWVAVSAEMNEVGDATVAVDRSAEAGQTYFYRLRGTTASGNVATFGPVKGTAGAPKEFALSAIWPNPSRGPVAMTFSVPRSAHVSLSVVDLQGREMSSLAEGQFKAGRYQINWDGRSDRGPVPAGLYFVRFITPDKKLVSRIAITR